MSRRREKAWEELLSRHVFGGGEEYFTDWEGVASELGLSPDDFKHPDPGYEYGGGWAVDVDEMREAAREAFFDRRNGEPPPLVMMTLKCQRCERRLDTLRVRSTRWVAPGYGSREGWKLENLRATSERWAKEIGDSISEMFRKFEDKSFKFDCPCGRKDIQFSMRRIQQTLDELTPAKPRWSPGGDDAYIIWPGTRYVSIRG